MQTEVKARKNDAKGDQPIPLSSRFTPKVYEKLAKSFKTDDELAEALENCEMDRLCQIEGISEKKAVSLILTYHGLDSSAFLKTERAERLYAEIVEELKGYCSTAPARNRMALLVPLSSNDIAKMNDRINFALDAKKLVARLPKDELRKHLRNISRIKAPQPKYDSAKAILVENDNWLFEYRKRGLDRYVQLASADDANNLSDFDVVIYAYFEGSLDDALSNADNVVSVPAGSKDFELVPETVLSWYYANYETLKNVASVRNIVGKDSVIPEILSTLDDLKQMEIDVKSLERTIMEERDRMNDELKSASSSINLAGEEILEVLSQGTPKRLQHIYNDILRGARERIKEKTGFDANPFIMKYPVDIDIDELERLKSSVVQRGKLDSFSKKAKAAGKLASIRKDVEEEVKWAFEFDYKFAIGCFACDYDLSKPHISSDCKYAFYAKGACHLGLARKGGQRVDYHVGQKGSKDNVVLLTGANSGGKTTLLETIGQMYIMAHMGLPVCAEECELSPVEELYFFTHRRNLDAGAFESFLKTFMPIAATTKKKMILADELEAMTELEAASKIIATFIELVNASDSHSVIVTHMAGEISKYTTVRVDGIEARGLDPEFNLIVDRTPKIGQYARSTPELIVMRLYERSSGETRKVYEKVLEKFKNVRTK